MWPTATFQQHYFSQRPRGMVVMAARRIVATSKDRGHPWRRFLSPHGSSLKAVIQQYPTSISIHSCCTWRWLAQVATSQCCYCYVVCSTGMMQVAECPGTGRQQRDQDDGDARSSAVGTVGSSGGVVVQSSTAPDFKFGDFYSFFFISLFIYLA